MSRICLLFALCALSLSANAFSGSPKAVDVPAGDLAAALQKLATQAEAEFVFSPGELKGAQTRGVHGTFTIEDAVTKLLEGTSFRLTKHSSGAFLISTAGAQAKTSAVVSRPATMRLVRSSSSAQEKVSTQESAEKKTSTSESTEEVKGVPEILVRGTRSINTDIQRTEDDVRPYVVFDAEDVRRSQATTLEEFFKSRLPQNTTQGTPSQDATSFYGSQSQIDLRGFGSNQTLILVDGRRLPGINAGGAAFGVRQPDINGIPLESIERIEILPSSASGIYGGGATGGVINIITRKDYSGFDLSLSYGNTSRSDAENFRVDGSAGFTLPDGTAVLLAGSRTDTSPLVGSDRDFNGRARALLLANNPGSIYNVATPPMGYTPNIRSQNGQNLVFDNLTPLGSNRTFVPVGYAGPTTDAGMALLANAGKYNLGQPDDVNGGQRSLTNDLTTTSASANIRRSFGPRVEAFADVSWMDNEGHALGSLNQLTTITLGPNALYNPFNTTILVRMPLVGLSAPMETGTDNLRGTAGVIVRLPHDWTASADHVWSRSSYSFATTNPVIGDPDGAGPGISSSTALANGTLNPMSDVNVHALNWAPYLFASPNYTFDADNVLRQTTLRLSGPVLHLPAGALTLSGMAEQRNEDASDGYENFDGGFGGVSFYPGTHQEVTTYYVEAVAPLLRSVELQVAARHDDYRTSSPTLTIEDLPDLSSPTTPVTYEVNEVQSTKYTIGLRYQPVRDLTLRTSFGTGFLPPSVSQIVTVPPYETPSISIIDKKRGNVLQTYTDVTLYTGGDPSLKPENSESFSAGIVLTPRWIEGLRLSMDYTRIRKTDEITALQFVQIIDLEDELPGRVIRGPLSAADQALGYTAGPVIGVNTRRVNVAGSRMSAYDIQLDYDFEVSDFGNLHFYLMGTWQPHLERKPLPDSEFVEFAGYFNGILERRANFGLTWERGPWSVGWNTQYYDSFVIYADNYTPAQITTATLNQGSPRIPSQMIHDLSAQLRLNSYSGFAGRLFENTEISMGVVNVFDEHPAVMATSNTALGYSIYVDPRLRRYTLALRKHF